MTPTAPSSRASISGIAATTSTTAAAAAGGGGGSGGNPFSAINNVSRMRAMERVLFNLHYRLSTFSLRQTSSQTRRVLEHLLLLLAICGFGALVLLHMSFVYYDGVSNLSTKCLTSIEGFQPDADLTHVLVLPPQTHEASGPPITSMATSTQALFCANSTCSQTEHRLHLGGGNPYCSSISSSTKSCSVPPILYSYSNIKGYLLLPHDNLMIQQLSVQYIWVSPTDGNCFGEPFLQALVWKLIGPETAFINWFLALHQLHAPHAATASSAATTAAVETHHAFVYCHKTSTLMDLTPVLASSISSRWMQVQHKLLVLLQICFLFFITTTLVSFTLRETQETMLEFTSQLRGLVSSHQPLQSLVTTHVLHNLIFVPIMVGMMFFLIQFYHGDKFLAFWILTIVWLCEVFSVIR